MKMKARRAAGQTDKSLDTSKTTPPLYQLLEQLNFIKTALLKHKILMKICLNQHGGQLHSPLLSPSHLFTSPAGCHCLMIYSLKSYVQFN